MDQSWNDNTAQLYLDKYGDHELNRLWLTHVTLTPDEVLLDIGCGGGASIKAAIMMMMQSETSPGGAKGSVARAIGIDPMPVMINAAKKLALPAGCSASVDFIVSDAENIPLPAGTVTLALANCSAIHWRNIDAGLSEAHRVLQTGGQFLIIEEAFASQTEEGRLASPQNLPEHLSKAGFVVAQHGHHEKDGESYWATLARKV